MHDHNHIEGSVPPNSEPGQPAAAEMSMEAELHSYAYGGFRSYRAARNTQRALDAAYPHGWPHTAARENRHDAWRRGEDPDAPQERSSESHNNDELVVDLTHWGTDDEIFDGDVIVIDLTRWDTDEP